MEEGPRLDFDCLLFHRRRGALGSTDDSAISGEERRDEEDERTGENDTVAGESVRQG
jgi:hypothetical protein